MTNYSAVGRKSKTKGSTYERTIAKHLTVWWGATFSRVPASGGLHWHSSMNAFGDIIAPPEAGFPFVIECKKREEWTLDNLFLNNKEIKLWWEQVVHDADESQRVPMLIFSRNRAEDFVMLPYNQTFLDNYIVHAPRASRMVTYVEYLDEHKRPHGFNTMVILLKDLMTYVPEDLRADFNADSYNWRAESQTTNLNGEYEAELEVPEDQIENHIQSLIRKSSLGESEEEMK